MDELDLEVLVQWKRMGDTKCPGCGRPLKQHIYNPALGREEVPEDYIPISVDCPAAGSIAEGQQSWRKANEGAFNRYNKGSGPDPSAGVFWLSRGPNEQDPFETMKPPEDEELDG